MNINSDVVRTKTELKEASKRKFRIERPDNKKRAKVVSRDDKRSLAGCTNRRSQNQVWI
jgi:hypothetical protein